MPDSREARLPTKREAAERYVNEQLEVMRRHGSLDSGITPEKYESIVQQCMALIRSGVSDL